MNSSMTSLPMMMVTFLSAGVHAIVPPRASTMARMGKNVLPSTMRGAVPCASMALVTPSTVMVGTPTRNTMTVCPVTAPPTAEGRNAGSVSANAKTTSNAIVRRTFFMASSHTARWSARNSHGTAARLHIS
jgi:hypothetical protein